MFSTMINGLVLGFVASPTCPSNGEEIKQGTRHGFSFALTVGLGAVTGDAIVLLAVLLGLMPLIESFPLIKTGLWLSGGLILLYVSWGIFSEIKTIQGVSAETSETESAITSNDILRAYGKGTAITTFNPFTVVWWIGLIAPMITAGQLPIVFASAVLIGSLIWFAILAVLLHVGRRYLNQTTRRWIIVISGCVVLGYSFYFFWQFFRGIV